MTQRTALTFLLWAVAGIAGAMAQTFPEDLSQLPQMSGLPDLFTFTDGSAVQSAEDWGRRRLELKALLLFYQYGRIPPAPDQVTFRTNGQTAHSSGVGTETSGTLVIGSEAGLEMRMVLYQPPDPGPHPVIIREEGSLGGSEHAGLFLKNNYMFVEYARHDLDPDKKDVVGPAQLAYPEYDWATLAVWAWGGMRVIDYLETRDDVDSDRIAITGHSRGGKMALLAAALDERFALAVPNGSGAGGAGASRVLGPGAESIGMNNKPHWYHERIQMFAEAEAHLPIDQHFLKALVAPRALLCIESTDDLFANPVGTYATTMAAMPVFELYQRQKFNGTSYRRGGHTFSAHDWKLLLEFAEWTFYDRSPVSGRSFLESPADVLPLPRSGGDTEFVNVDSEGNRPDEDYPRVGAIGAVADQFQIGKHKVSNFDYARFLNSVAVKRDPHGLYHTSMRISRSETEDGYSYSAHPATEQAAVTWVSWYDALRYCNWHNSGDTESGAYRFQGETRTGRRSRSADYFLPTEDEWYKAAYYDPESRSYRLLPLRNSHKTTEHVTLREKSTYGMEGASDDIWEWTESSVGSLFRCLRSDSWFQGNNRQAYGRFYSNPKLELGHVGFRIARRTVLNRPAIRN